MRHLLLNAFWFAVLLTSCRPIVAQQNSLITNSNFSEWKGGKPVGWQISIGATNGANTPTSTVSHESSSLQLTGNVQTRAWKLVSQSVKVSPGETLRLTFRAKVAGLKREGRQFDNCHIGLWPKDANGRGIGNHIQSVYATDYQDHSVVARMPPNAATADLSIFLSKTGTLSVEEVTLQKYSAKQSFDLLVQELNAKYSYFKVKNIDFAALQKKYAPLANAAKTPLEFCNVVGDMFAEFHDIHVWLSLGQKRVSNLKTSFSPNYNFAAIDKQLKDVVTIKPLGLVGTTSEGFGYVRVTALSGVSNDQVRQMMQEIGKRYSSPGMIVDLRRNGGGAEGVAQAIAGLFADKQYTYARQQFRSGDGFAETAPRTVKPARGQTYSKPIVCLSGPGAVSSAEAFVLMMKALDHCTVVGLPTRGASGNPQPVSLPNGVDAWFSRWQSLTPDGAVIEGVGVQPDIRIEHDLKLKSDSTFRNAIQILSTKAKN